MLTLSDQHPIYLIIDPVDECPNNSGIPTPRERVLQFIVELNSALEFAQPAASEQQSQETCMTEYNTDPISGPSTPDDRSDASAPKDTSRTAVPSAV